ncbi:MAG: ATP-binding cassette domain-containing protein [Paracoccaceae bacterium]|jgi:thiamine transport system ATP-binding protein|nr:ATP-binding cassette domain-containing protein [Paracoccaceae bacterium]
MGLRVEHMELRKGGFLLSADFSIGAGSLTAVIGPSGAGKSSLFDGIAGFTTPQSGEVIWRDKVLNRLLPGDRPVAMLFQDNNLFPHLTVRQNIALAITQKSRLTECEVLKISTVLDQVGLKGFQNRTQSALSGGQISRVALARLLLQNKPVWLLDEPFSALGPALKAEMLQLVREIAIEVKATVLMITHDPADAMAFADQTLLVADAVVSGPFATADLLENPPKALKDYLG